MAMPPASIKDILCASEEGAPITVRFDESSKFWVLPVIFWELKTTIYRQPGQRSVLSFVREYQSFPSTVPAKPNRIALPPPDVFQHAIIVEPESGVKVAVSRRPFDLMEGVFPGGSGVPEALK